MCWFCWPMLGSKSNESVVQQREKMSRQETIAKTIRVQPIPSEASSHSEFRWITEPALTTDWLTAREAARYLKVKVRTVLLWARQGKIKGHVLSGTKRHVWRFLQTDLDAALLESPVLPSEAPSVCPAERMGK